jgi:hypothetical protein
MSRPDDLLEEEWDDWLDDDQDYEGPQEPHCFGCGDRGTYPAPARAKTDEPARDRAHRRRCVDCNPSPRQRRRWPKHLRRITQVSEKMQRDAERRRARGELDTESPF